MIKSANGHLDIDPTRVSDRPQAVGNWLVALGQAWTLISNQKSCAHDLENLCHCDELRPPNEAINMSHRLPPLNGVRAFEASARHLSFKLAASELGVTAGAVSQQVKALEAALSTKLFKRLPRGLVLTAAGDAYLPSLSAAFRLISKATEDIAPALPSRKLRIGVSATVKSRLPSKWPRCRSDLQRFVGQVRVTEDVELVRSGELDGVLHHRRVGAAGLSCEMIAVLQDEEVSQEIHYISPTGLAGCRQSRALVASLSELCAANH